MSDQELLADADAGEVLRMLLEAISWVRLAEERANPTGPTGPILQGAELVLRAAGAGHVVEIDLPIRSLHGPVLVSPRLGPWLGLGPHFSALSVAIESVLDAMEEVALYGSREWQARMLGARSALQYLARAAGDQAPASIEQLIVGLLEHLGCRESFPIPLVSVSTEADQ